MDPLELSATHVEAMNEAQTAEVLAAWVRAERRELPEALADSKSKAHARLAKKALYQLKSSGVALTQAATATPVAAPEVVNDFPAVLSGIVGTGDRALFFGRPIRGGGFEVYQGIINDELGILQLDRTDSSRSIYRKRINEIDADPDLRVLKVSFDRVRSELARALAINEATGLALPDITAHSIRRLQLEADTSPFQPLPPVEANDAQLAADAKPLHAAGELSQWLPSEGALKVLDERLAGAPAGAEATSVVHAVADEAFTKPVRITYARRLWAMAEVFEATHRAALAAHCRAEARLLFHEDTPSAFAREMFNKVLGLRASLAATASKGTASR